MNLPEYPDARPLALSDREVFEEAFKADPPVISEFTFTNLYAWRSSYAFQISRLDGFIVLSARLDGRKVFFRPIGPGDRRQTVASLAGERAPFVRIPGDDAEALAGAAGLIREPDRDNFDYLYTAGDLINLKGKRFDGKRNLIRKFRRQNEYSYVELGERTARECLEFEEFWCFTRGCDREGLLREREAVREMCLNFSAFGLTGGGLSVGGRIRAVAIGQRLNPDTLVMHVLKAVPGLQGGYQAMHNEFLSRAAVDCRFVNMEQDLGIEGLRKAKLSYQPVRLVEKYTLRIPGNG